MTKTIQTDEELIYDIEYLRYLLLHERDGWVETYVEDNFPPESWHYQKSLMIEFPYFGNKILDNYELENDQKIEELLEKIAFGKSKIITIIGGRGQGKTALAMFLIEEAYQRKFHKNIYYIKKGERPEWLPAWIHSAQTMEEVPNNSLAMLDETAIEYGSRNFWKDENKSFTERLVILRHKDISLILVTQHSKLVDINIRRLSDIIIYKKGADFDMSDRKQDERDKIRRRLIPRVISQALIEIKNDQKYYLISTPLPEFWDDQAVSKTFRGFNPEEMRRKMKDHSIEKELELHREKEKIRAQALKEAGVKEVNPPIPT